MKNKGTILLVTVLLIVVVSIYLAGYSIWTLYDQRNLMRQEQFEKARALARAGLERAKTELFLDSGTWLDENINVNTTVIGCTDLPNHFCPDSNNSNNFYTIRFADSAALPPYSVNLGEGNYTVQIDYLQCLDFNICAEGTFYDKRLRLHSTGTVPGFATTATVFASLEEIVSWYTVKNLATPPAPGGNLYAILQPAVTESGAADKIGITEVRLSENITINDKEDIKGCYDPDFNFRHCMNYPTRISGANASEPTVKITGPAEVKMGGITIE